MRTRAITLTAAFMALVACAAAQPDASPKAASGVPPDVMERGVPKRPGLPMRANELQSLVESARQDLAQRLGTPVEQVRLVDFAPATWPDASLGCGASGTGGTPVRGFRLQLSAGGRSYTYHTGPERVAPCPPIESE